MQTALTTPEAEVKALLEQVADEYGLQVALGMPSAGTTQPAQAVATPVQGVGLAAHPAGF